MSSNDENTGKEHARKLATLSVDLLQGVQRRAEKHQLKSDGLAKKIDEIQSAVSAIDTHEPPKKLDWIVFTGFVIFMITIIGAVFGQSIIWLGIAFLVMPVVIMFGLINNVKNMQPDWGSRGQGVEIYVPNAPQSLQQASGNASNRPQSKRQYWFVLIVVGLGSTFFFAMGLFLLFSEFAVDNF